MYTKDTICRDNGKFVCGCGWGCVCVFSFTVSCFASPYLLYQWNLLLEEKAKLADPQNWVEFMNLFFKVFTVAILSKAETFTQWAKLQKLESGGFNAYNLFQSTEWEGMAYECFPTQERAGLSRSHSWV